MSKTKKWLGNIFILVWVLMLLGIAAVRWNFLPLQIGLLAASLGAVIAFIYGILLLPVVLYKLLFRKPLPSSSLLICIFGLLPAAVMLISVGPAGFKSPAIHDITTDIENPPGFVLAAEQRNETDNSTEYEGEVISRLQEEAYPQIQPLYIDAEPDKVMAAVKSLVNQMGWTLLGTRQSDMPGATDGVGTVEAVASSALFGFEDDVVIRLSAARQGTRVDVRSASRVGLGDLGANARRIASFNRELAEKF